MSGAGCAPWTPWKRADAPPYTAAAPPNALRTPAPTENYRGPVWPVDDWIVVTYDGDPLVAEHPPWRFRPDVGALEPLRLPDDGACRRTLYEGIQALPDGRLGVVKYCEGIPSADPSTHLGSMHFMAYDLATGDLERLVQEPWRFGVGGYSWNREMTRGMVAHDSAICASLAWLTPQRVEDATIVVEDGGQRWRLDALFQRRGSEGCDDLGRARGPAWSPALAGGPIAFFASPPATGVSGQGRIDSRWGLFLMDPVALAPRKVLADLRRTANPVWSPDGRWLAFSAQMPDGAVGLWLFSPASGTLKLLTAAPMDLVAWSPDGSRIAGLFDLNGGKLVFDRHRVAQPSRKDVLLFDTNP